VGGVGWLRLCWLRFFALLRMTDLGEVGFVHVGWLGLLRRFASRNDGIGVGW